MYVCIYIYIYIYICIGRYVCMYTCRKASIEDTKSGAGEQFLPLLCRGKARVKGVFFHRLVWAWKSHHLRLRIRLSRRTADKPWLHG